MFGMACKTLFCVRVVGKKNTRAGIAVVGGCIGVCVLLVVVVILWVLMASSACYRSCKRFRARGCHGEQCLHFILPNYMYTHSTFKLIPQDYLIRYGGF